MRAFIYKKNYTSKVVIVVFCAWLLAIITGLCGVEMFEMPIDEVAEYHSNILTINSIFSGFALTNLGILLTISDEQLINKLAGTDILSKRNTVIAHSIIFGTVSILISLINMLGVGREIVDILNDSFKQMILRWGFNIEILALCISVMYFIISIKKIIELLNHIYVPKRKYSGEEIKAMKEQIKNKV